MNHKHLIIAIVIAISFLAGALIPTALTQSASQSQYALVSYMKVDPGKEGAYVQMEREVWKPIHQQRVKDGKLQSWLLYAVRFPGGDNREYGFLTVETYKSIQDAEGAYDSAAAMTSLLKKVHPNMSVEQLMSQASSSRSLVRSEVIKLVDRTD
jgi:hypothetical protein